MAPNKYLVPITYLAYPGASGCSKGLGLFIASLFGGTSDNSIGMISGQEMFFLGGMSLLGFSKQPRFSPYARPASTG